MNSLTISVTIARPLEEVYEFLSIPANFSKWAAGLGELQERNHEWFVHTPHGRTDLASLKKILESTSN
jgi:uncharacterized protein YndB with AHSA1/START domain